MKTLDQIAIETKTDKSSHQHNYCVKYEKYLPFKRDQEIKILEIGVFNGSSINMWREYYSNSYVVGIDIDPSCAKFQKIENNLFVEIGSQIDSIFLSKVLEKHGPFDLIIDDGSHMQSHMIFSFEKLFPALKKSGIYIVEDTCCSYWPEYEGGLNKCNSSIEYFKSLIEHVNFFGQKLKCYQQNLRREDYHMEQIKTDNPYKCRTDIESINFLNSTILVTKKDSELLQFSINPEIHLNDVTLICIDGRDPEKALKTLSYNTKLGIKFKEVKLFANKNIENLNTNIEVIIPQSHVLNDLNSYGDFLLTELHNFINTEFCLIIQTDGVIINPNLWDFGFLLYDYIGAPWHGEVVGNGGFSLRSKKILRACSEILAKLNKKCWGNEDNLVCRHFRSDLENIYNCKFAPFDVASKFSKELLNRESYTFGFHGKYKEYESYLNIVH